MAFQTSASAFGMKPTTNMAFGSFGTPKPPGQTSTFGGASQPSSGFGAFGSMGTQPQQNQNQPQGSNIFGNPFGQSQQQQSQVQPTTNIFGQPAGGQQIQLPSQNLYGTGAFSGNTGLNQNTQNAMGQPAQSTGLFGNIGANTSQQQQQSQPRTTGFGSFGVAKPANNAPAWGLTGNTAPGALGSSMNVGNGSSIFGQSQFQQQPLSLSTTGQQVASAPLFTRTTKFNDLPEDIKKVFENIDSHIQGRVHICNELKQRKLGEEPAKGAEEIRNVHKDLVHVINQLRTDTSLTRNLKYKMDQAVQDVIISTRIIDGFRNPQQHGAHLKNYVNFPLEYFTRVTEQLKERLQWFTNTIEQIERKITAEAGHVSASPQAIASTLQAQHATFIALANRAATVDAELQKLKATYTQLWRAATGSARDPFNDPDRGGDLSDFGLESLRVS